MTDVFGPRPYVSPIRIVPDPPMSEVVKLGVYRTYHECYKCGHFEGDPKVLNEHEDNCKLKDL